jgi:hypothetical protein
VTTEVELSGPAMVKGSELRSATTNALMVVEMKIAAIPEPSHGESGPEKIKAAKDTQ